MRSGQKLRGDARFEKWISKDVFTFYLQISTVLAGNLSCGWLRDDIRVWLNNIEVLRSGPSCSNANAKDL